jgi:hypothetical protein
MGIDWYPRARFAQLQHIKTWNAVLKARGLALGVPQNHIDELAADETAAQTVFDKVQSGDRTPTSVVECNEAFNEMEAEARFIKKRYLLVPPLALADLAAFMLPLPDDVHTPVPPPVGQPALTLTYPGGPHILAARFAPLAGTEPPDARGDYGYALYLGVMPHGGATLEQAASVKHYLMKEPLSGDELLHHRFTRRKKELTTFAAEEAGMTAYFCARYENQKGEHGAWGTVASAVIP